ncbi:MAG: hypothetical protein VXX04_06875, partial [Actinomycetota bacterium]|nr:hypothetical protein [Actinomycetota bacterium]
MNPWVIKEFVLVGGVNGSWTRLVAETYIHTFVSYVPEDQVRFNNDGAGNLVIIFSDSIEYTIGHFEDGYDIVGLWIHGAIFDAEIESEYDATPAGSAGFAPSFVLTSTYSEAFTDYKTFHFEFNAVAFDDAVISLRDGVSIVGTTGDDDLRGFDTDDHDGSTYDDTLVGLAGNDTLYGGEGNDTLIGGPGRDLQFGGGGDDTYLLRPGDGDVRSEGDA